MSTDEHPDWSCGLSVAARWPKFIADLKAGPAVDPEENDMTDKATKKPEPGSFERFQLDSHDCRTPDDLAILLRTAGSHVLWINQLLTAAMRDVLYYDRARAQPYMNLHHTEALMHEDMYRSIVLPGETSTAVAKGFTYDQMSNLVATTSGLFAASRAAAVAAHALNANVEYMSRTND